MIDLFVRQAQMPEDCPLDLRPMVSDASRPELDAVEHQVVSLPPGIQGVGLQELLAYFDPMVAGVIIPGFGLAALAFIPYVDRNPSVRPSDRKLAISIYTIFFMAAAVLTIFGSFFRGPGFNFTFPWRDGIFFDDLLTILGHE